MCGHNGCGLQGLLQPNDFARVSFTEEHGDRLFGAFGELDIVYEKVWRPALREGEVSVAL